MTSIVCVSRYGDTWYLTGKRSARFKCFEASKISIPMIRLSAPISNTISSLKRLLTTSCLRSSSLMYTRSDLALYRISIVDLPFPVKDVNGHGDYNISFGSEKDFDFFLLVVFAQACLVKVKNFALTPTTILGGYRMTARYYFYNHLPSSPLVRPRVRGYENQSEWSI